MFRLHSWPRPSVVVLPVVGVHRHVAMAHEHLAEQIHTVVKVLTLLLDWIWVRVVVRVVGFADFVDTVKCVEDVEADEVTALVVAQGH